MSATAVSASIPLIAAQPSNAAFSPDVRLSAAVSPLLPSVEAAAVTEYAPENTPALFDGTVDAQAIGGFASAGDFIINAYNAIEPWVAWGFELVQWGMGFVPLLWWVAPGVDLAYFTVEPVVASLVYSFAYLIDGNFSLIGPTIQAGLQEAAYNFVQYSIYWIESIVPSPPLPPWPPFPSAATAAGPAAVTRAAATVAAESTGTVSDTAEAASDTTVADSDTAQTDPAGTDPAAADPAVSAETAGDQGAAAPGTDLLAETQPITEAPAAITRTEKRTAIRAEREATTPGTSTTGTSTHAATPTADTPETADAAAGPGGKSGAAASRSGR